MKTVLVSPEASLWLFGPNFFFRAKIFFSGQNSFLNKFAMKTKFFAKFVCNKKIYFRTKILWTNFLFGPTFVLDQLFFQTKIFWVQKNLRGWGQKLWGRGPKHGVIALWSIWSLNTESWPHTKPRTLRKVFGRWWVVVVGGWWFTVNLVFCFGPKLWFWSWTKLNNTLRP